MAPADVLFRNVYFGTSNMQLLPQLLANHMHLSGARTRLAFSLKAMVCRTGKHVFLNDKETLCSDALTTYLVISTKMHEQVLP